MASAAGRELRRHPGRFVATWLAIAISVAFVVVASVSTTTLQAAVGRQLTLGLANADLVVSVTGTPANSQNNGLSGAEAEKTFAAVGGVTDVSHVRSAPLILSKGDVSIQVQATGLSADAKLRPSDVGLQGIWPADASQIVLNKASADALRLSVGDTIQTAAGSSGAPASMRFVGVTNQDSTVNGGVAWVSAPWFAGVYQSDDPTGSYAVMLQPGADQAAVEAALQTASLGDGFEAHVVTKASAAAAAGDRLTGNAAAWSSLLWVFAGIAIIVGLVTVINTCTALMGRRRRELGLIRAVGADTGHIRWALLRESVLAGVEGSVVGVVLGLGAAALLARLMGTLSGGLAISWWQLAIAFVLGVLVMLIAAHVPAWKATRLPLLGALRPEAPVVESRRASGARKTVAVVLLVAGAAGTACSFMLPPVGGTGLLVAIGGGCVLVLGVVVAARLFMPPLVGAVGTLVAKTGPVAKLAVSDLGRSPRRTAAIAAAFVLAVGLIVGLQTTMASVRDTVLGQLGQNQPVAVRVVYGDGTPTSLPTALVDGLRSVPGVDAFALLPGVAVTDGQQTPWFALAYTPDAARVAVDGPKTLPPNQALVNPASWPDGRGDQLTLSSGGQDVTFQVVRSAIADVGQVLVSQSTLRQLGDPQNNVALWLSVPDQAFASSVAADVRGIVGDDPQASVSGAVFQAGSIVDGVFLVSGAAVLLLVVVVIVALVGLGNTLSLSVWERGREPALLRALGVSSGGLRRVALIEALLVAVVASIVGIVAGLCLSVIGVFVAQHAVGAVGPVAISVDWWWTIGSLVVAVVAALLASIVPGGRAAKVETQELSAVRG